MQQLYDLNSWLFSASKKPENTSDEIKNFAQFLGRKIQSFQKEISQNFLLEDQKLREKSNTRVYYLFKAHTDSLSVVYKTKLTQDEYDDEYTSSTILFSATLASGLDYVGMDAETRLKIGNFFDTHKSSLLDSTPHKSCLRWENQINSHYLTNANVAAKMRMDYDPSEIQIEELEARIAEFVKNAADMEKLFEKFMEENAIEKPTGKPFSLLDKSVSILANQVQLSKSDESDGARLTNITGAALLQKINAFNAILNKDFCHSQTGNIQGKYPLGATFRMKDFALDIKVKYNLNQPQLELMGQIIPLMNFNYKNPIQSKLINLFERHAIDIQPSGGWLEVVNSEQNDAGYTLETHVNLDIKDLNASALDNTMGDFYESTLAILNTLSDS